MISNEVVKSLELAPLPEGEWQLRELSEKHKLVAALLAQGAKRAVIADAAGYTPEYVTWLQRQPLFREYLRSMVDAANVQLEALYCKTVDVIADTMDAGGENALKAAKLQLEATGRIGSHGQAPAPQDVDRLEVLAERLTQLLQNSRKRVYENGEVSEAQIIPG